MATTGFWPVKSRLKDVICYAENPDKTTEKRFWAEDLWAAIRYTENPKKTDRTMYVSGINCPTQRAYQCIMATTLLLIAMSVFSDVKIPPRKIPPR